MSAINTRRSSVSTAVPVALLVVVGLASCTQESPPASHTVAEYRANADLRREELARCTDDPGTLAKNPDCINAREAERIEDIGSVRSSPTIKLPRPPEKH